MKKILILTMILVLGSSPAMTHRRYSPNEKNINLNQEKLAITSIVVGTAGLAFGIPLLVGGNAISGAVMTLFGGAFTYAGIVTIAEESK